jgi:hypothetical protein
MTKRAASVLLASVVVLAVSSVSQSQEQPKQPSPEEMKAMMKAWLDSTKPGKQHAKLAALAGEWDVTMKMFMAGPDGPAAEYKGTSTLKSILGGRFIEESYNGEIEMPDETGALKKQKFEGRGMLGFDNYKKMYVGTWSDSMSTMIFSYKGADVPGSDTINFYGEMDEPMLGMQDRTVRLQHKTIDKDKFTTTMYDLAVGDSYKVFEITYVRRK